MTKIVKSIEIPINQTTPQPPNGYGVLYASASDNAAGYTIQYTNAAGDTYDLTKSTSYYNVTYFTGSADRTDVTYFWNKPAGLRYLEICAVGAGGGGGIGGANLPNSQGGIPGGGGAIIWATFPTFLLTDTEYRIGIQRGGAGGVIGSSTGASGGSSSFADSAGRVLVLADGGGGGSAGAGGISKAGVPGYVSQSIPIGSGLAGGAGGTMPNVPAVGTIAGFANAVAIFFNDLTPNISDAAVGEWGTGTGGGGAGGTIVANTTLAVAGSGSNGYQYNTLRINNNNDTSFPGSNGSDGGAGTNNLITTLLRISSSYEAIYGLGGGGHGGGSSLTVGGRGGKAGFYGAGGGGGGAVPTSQTSGAGGSGSAGLVILTEYYF